MCPQAHLLTATATVHASIVSGQPAYCLHYPFADEEKMFCS